MILINLIFIQDYAIWQGRFQGDYSPRSPLTLAIWNFVQLPVFWVYILCYPVAHVAVAAEPKDFAKDYDLSTLVDG